MLRLNLTYVWSAYEQQLQFQLTKGLCAVSGHVSWLVIFCRSFQFQLIKRLYTVPGVVSSLVQICKRFNLNRSKDSMSCLVMSHVWSSCGQDSCTNKEPGSTELPVMQPAANA